MTGTLTGPEARAVEIVACDQADELAGARAFRMPSSRPGRFYLTVITPGGLTFCSCPAGNAGRDCKHRIAAGLIVQVEQQEAASCR